MSQVGFEPMIPVFERAKKFHALNSTASALFIYLFRSRDSSVDIAAGWTARIEFRVV
jgi:hypothetical protein